MLKVIRLKLRENIFKYGILFIYIIMLCLGVFEYNNSSEREYILTIPVLILVVVFNNCKIISKVTYAYKMCFCMFSVYIYGLVLGMINENSWGYMIRDHAGMSLYSLIFVLGQFKVEYKKLTRTVLYVAVMGLCIQILYSLAFTYNYSLFVKLPFSEYLGKGWYGDEVRLMINGKNLINVVASVAMFNLLKERKHIRCLLVVVLVGVVEMMMPTDASKLSYLVAIGSVVIAFILSRKGSLNKHLTKMALSVISVLIIMLFYPKIMTIFSPEDDGNSLRVQQITYVIKSISLLGHGHGANYHSINREYSIEVSYLDLLYKYGVLSIVVYGVYYRTIKKMMHCIIKSFDDVKNNYSPAVVAGLLSFFMSGLSNPILFSPLNVMCHMFSLVILDGYSKEHEYE